MSKFTGRGRRYQHSEQDSLFERANKHWEEGKLQSAFRLFLASAKAGDSGSQVNLGNFYIDGIGVKANRAQALRWYRRAYLLGERSAASNIGLVFRDEQKLKYALRWFERARDLGDGDANLEIAKIYIDKNDRVKATGYLKQALKANADDVTEGSKEEANRLLKILKSGMDREK